MKQLMTMGAVALGMTFGLACGDAARTLLPPDVDAQAPDGGEVDMEPTGRILEADCELAPPGHPQATFELPTSDERIVFGAKSWLCGVTTSTGEYEFPVEQCAPAGVNNLTDNRSQIEVEGNTAKVMCGYVQAEGEWKIAKRVVLWLPR